MIFKFISALKSGQDISSYIIEFVVILFVVFCTLPVHEYAHAWAATKLGDQTARLKGRLTINPMAHIEPLGALMIFLVGFGYAKPVPVNMHNFKIKNKKLAMAIVSLAGPLSNLIMALIFLFISTLTAYFGSDKIVFLATSVFFQTAAYINVSLAVFNLLPIPPLDGSRLITLLVPDKYYYQLMRYERYIIIGLFVLLFTGALATPLYVITSAVIDGITWLVELPFKLIK